MHIRIAFLTASLLGAGCSGSLSGDDSIGAVGEAVVEVPRVPAKVACIEVSIGNSTRTVDQKFDVKAGLPASLTLSNLPAGVDTVNASAFNLACSAVTAATPPDWVIVPVTATFGVGMLTTVPLVFKRPPSASLPVVFQDNFKVTPITGLSGMTQGIAIADLDGDGLNEILLAEPAQLVVVRSTGNLDFTIAQTINLPYTGNGVVVADFNGDGKLDVALPFPTTNKVGVLLNSGTSLAAPVTFTVGAGPVALVAADFDFDGRVDLVSANSGDNSVSLLLSTSTAMAASFKPATRFPVAGPPYDLVEADFNRSGQRSLAVALGGSVQLLINQGSGMFSTGATLSTPALGLAVGDFNGDGNPDLAAATYSSGVAIYANNGAAAFTLLSTIAAPGDNRTIATGDFNADGRPDLVSGAFDNGTLTITYDQGATFSPGLYSTPQPLRAVATGDLNADGLEDVVTGFSTGGFVDVWTNLPPPK